MKSRDLTQKELHKILDYDKKTGVFTWKNGMRAGRQAGCFYQANPTICYNRVCIQARRAAWIYVNGKIPRDRVVLHKNGDTHDLSIKNLELVSHQIRSLSRSDAKNIEFKKSLKKYEVYMTIDGVKTGRKSFENLEDAQAYSKKLRRKIINDLKKML